MTTLERVRVDDVLELQRRAVVVDPMLEYAEIGVRSFGKGIFHKEPVRGADLGQKRMFRVEPGDLVISNVFAWEGAIAQAADNDAGRIGSHRFMTFTAKDHDRIDTGWASWFFLSEVGLELIRMASPGSAGRNRTLAIDRFEALEIPLPAIEEQRRVAQHLDRVVRFRDDAQLSTYNSQRIHNALIISLATRPDLTGESKVSDGWLRVRLGDVLTQSVSQEAVSATRTYPNVGIYSFGKGLFAKPDIDGSTTSAKILYRISAGQFIYSRLFAFEGAYTYVPTQFDGRFVSNEFPTFDPDPAQLDARWLAACFRSPKSWSALRGSSVGIGVRRQRVPVDALLEHTVLLPPIKEQRRMVNQLEMLDRSRKLGKRSLTYSESLVSASLNEAFRLVK